MSLRHSPSHGSATIVLVLACLLVVSAIAGSMTHTTMRTLRVVQIQHQLRQTELLLDAGILRAAKQLQADPSYSGESWNPDLAIGRFSSPTVDIEVTAENDDPAVRLVNVVARLGIDATDPQSTVSLMRRSHSFRHTVPTSSNAE